MKKAFVIIRVSSQDQLKGYGPDVQWLDDVLPNAPLLGLEVSEQYRRIIHESATGWERPKFEGLMREASSLYNKKEIEALLFPRVDRESRFLFGSFPLLCEVVKAGVKVFFARERLELDPNNSESTERYLNKATQAQAYVETMKTNTMMAKQKLANRGILPAGTGRGLYGFRWDRSDKKRVPIEYEIKVVEKIFEMLTDGMSPFRVAKTLNEQGIPTKSGGKWHPHTVERLATNSAYIGITYYYKTKGSRKTALVAQPKDKWVMLSEVTPSIISPELFERVQEVLRHNKEQRPARVAHDYLLTGHIVCADCGGPVTGSCLSRKHRYYRCRATQATATRGATCKAKYIRADYIEEVVWHKMSEVLENPDIVLAELQRQVEANTGESQDVATIDKEIAKVQRRLKDYVNQEKRLAYELRYGEISKDIVLDEITHLKNDRNADLASLAKLHELKNRLATLVKAEVKLTEFCSTVRTNLRQCTIHDKRMALDALGVRVTASSDTIKIEGVIPIELTHTQSSSDVTTIAQTSA